MAVPRRVYDRVARVSGRGGPGSGPTDCHVVERLEEVLADALAALIFHAAASAHNEMHGDAAVGEGQGGPTADRDWQRRGLGL